MVAVAGVNGAAGPGCDRIEDGVGVFPPIEFRGVLAALHNVEISICVDIEEVAARPDGQRRVFDDVLDPTGWGRPVPNHGRSRRSGADCEVLVAVPVNIHDQCRGLGFGEGRSGEIAGFAREPLPPGTLLDDPHLGRQRRVGAGIGGLDEQRVGRNRRKVELGGIGQGDQPGVVDGKDAGAVSAGNRKRDDRQIVHGNHPADFGAVGGPGGDG